MPRSRATQSTELVAVSVEWATRRRSAAGASRVSPCSITIKATSAVICAHLARADCRRVLFISVPSVFGAIQDRNEAGQVRIGGYRGYLTLIRQKADEIKT